MHPLIPTASVSLGALLGGASCFVVPAYQRGYAWTIREANQLLDDIIAASGVESDELKEADYFLGSILMLDADLGETCAFADGGARTYEMVDGQQRLITLSLMICVLRDLQENAASDIAQTLNALIMPEGGLVGAQRPAITDGSGKLWRFRLRGSQQSFLTDCVFAPGACGEMPDEDTLGTSEARLFEIREHFVAVLSQFDDAQCAQLAEYLLKSCHFVVMVTRDIDRAHRMFLVLNGRGRPLSRNDILKAEILSSILPDASDGVVRAWETAAERLGPEDFEAFFGHIRTIYGQRRPQIIAGMRSVISNVGGAQTFLADVFEPMADIYAAILKAEHSGSPHSEAIRHSLVYLGRLSGTEWVPAAMVAMARNRDDPARLSQLLSEIDRFAHLLRVLCMGRGKRVTRFAPVIAALKEGQSIETACRFDREERKAIAYHLRDLHGRAPQLCKLLLLRINEYLAGRPLETDLADWTVEHVLPKRPSPSSEWREWFAEPREREMATQSLGNLLLVPVVINERARNQSFEKKKQLYQIADDDPMAPLKMDVLNASTWRVEQVLARQSALNVVLDEMWALGLEKDRAQPSEAILPVRRKRQIGRY